MPLHYRKVHYRKVHYRNRKTLERESQTCMLFSCYESTLELYPQDEVTLALNKFRSCQREEPDRWCECFLHVDADGNVIPPTTPGAKMDVASW